MRTMIPVLSAVSVSGLLLLSSCSIVENLDNALPDNRDDYQKSRTMPPLEIPPTLNSERINDTFEVDAARLTEYQQQRDSDVRKVKFNPSTEQQYSDNFQLQRENRLSWIKANYAPAQLWTPLKQFWREAGYVLLKLEKAQGLLETDWLQEAGERLKFRVRLEPRIDNTTEIFLTRRAEKELDAGDVFVYDISWQPLPADPSKEYSTLRTLLNYLMSAESQGKLSATPTTNAATTEEGDTVTTQKGMGQIESVNGALALRLNGNQQQSWRMVGLALDRAGFTIEDRNRQQGEYQVRYLDPDKKRAQKGFWSRVFGSNDKQAAQADDLYQLRLSENAHATLLQVINADGRVDSSATAERMLSLIQTQLR